MESKEIYQIGKLLMEISGRGAAAGAPPSKTLYEYHASDIPNISLIFECCLLSLGRYVIDGDTGFFSSGKNLFSVFFARDGRFTVTTENRAFVLRGGQILFIRDTENYLIEKSGGFPAELTVMRCTGSLPRGYYELMGKSAGRALTPEDSGAFTDVFEKLYYASRLTGSEKYAYMSATVSQLFFMLFRCREPDEEAVSAELPGWVTDVIAYAKSEFSNGITPADMAARSGVSGTQFYTRFREYTGQTPLQYLTGLRINSAKTLLVTTDFQVKYISQIVGYAGCSRFIEKFRKVTGLTPEEYRSHCRSV